MPEVERGRVLTLDEIKSEIASKIEGQPNYSWMVEAIDRLPTEDAIDFYEENKLFLEYDRFFQFADELKFWLIWDTVHSVEDISTPLGEGASRSDVLERLKKIFLEISKVSASLSERLSIEDAVYSVMNMLTEGELELTTATKSELHRLRRNVQRYIFFEQEVGVGPRLVDEHNPLFLTKDDFYQVFAELIKERKIDLYNRDEVMNIVELIEDHGGSTIPPLSVEDLLNKRISSYQFAQAPGNSSIGNRSGV